MEQSRSGHNQADSRFSSQVANGLGSIAGGLLVAHSDVLQSGGLEGHRQLDDRDADDTKDIFHALRNTVYIF